MVFPKAVADNKRSSRDDEFVRPAYTACATHLRMVLQPFHSLKNSFDKIVGRFRIVVNDVVVGGLQMADCQWSPADVHRARRLETIFLACART